MEEYLIKLSILQWTKWPISGLDVYEEHLTPWQCLPLWTCLRRASDLFCWSGFNESVIDKIQNQKLSSKMVPADVNDTQRNAEYSSFHILNKVIFKSRDSINDLFLLIFSLLFSGPKLITSGCQLRGFYISWCCCFLHRGKFQAVYLFNACPRSCFNLPIASLEYLCISDGVQYRWP